MAKYKVELSAELMPVWVDIEVEADSKEEAMELAREQAASLSVSEWETSDGSIECIQADNAYEVSSEAAR